MKRRMKKFAEGDLIDTMAEDANDRIQAATNQGRPAKSEMYTAEPASDSEETPSKAPSKVSFKSAFAEARKAGDKTFEWEGKKYTTDIAGAKKPTEKKSESVTEKKPAPAKTEPAKAEPVKAEKKDSGFGPKNTFLTKDRLDKSKTAMRSGWSNPFEGVSKAIGEGNRIAAVDREQRKERVAAKGDAGMKRGGAVKKMASGGSASASRRGDGIAQRGKTRGKMR